MTRFVANLDCEATWAAEAALARDPDAACAPLPGRLLARLSALGTLLGALAERGDRVWTPLPVAPQRVRPGPGGARPVSESGPLAGLSPPGRVIAWGETSAVAAHRESGTRTGEPERPPARWRDRLCAMSPPSPELARQAADRALAARLAVLPGAGWVRSREELGRHLAAGGAAASPRGRWVLKAPFGAAARDRLRGSGADVAAGDTVRLARLLALHGRLRFEPWMERTADFGGLAIVDAGAVRPVGLHALQMSAGGALRGIRPLSDEDEDLAPGERRALETAVRAAGAALQSLGYRGPFGVDAFRHVDAAGETHFHAPCEVNARLTFGFVARALAETAGWDPVGADPAPTLRFGSPDDLAQAGDAAWPLLLPGDDDPAAAWLS